MRKIAAALTFFIFTMCCMVLGPAPAALAEEPEQPRLTLAEAIDKAIKHSKVAQRELLEIDRTEVGKNDAAENLEVIPGDSLGANVQLEMAFYGSLTTDLTWRMSKKNYDARLDGIALEVCQQYWEIMKLQEKLQVKEVAVEKARLDLHKSRSAYSAGLVAKISQGGAFLGLEQAAVALVRAETDLETTQNELETAYAKFNQLVGLNSKDRPNLVDRAQMHPLEIENLEALTQRAIADSPSVWLAEQKISMDKYLQNLYFYTGQYTSFEEKEVEQRQSELGVVSAREATRLAVRNFYYTLKTLEETYQAAQNAVGLAEESLRVTQVMFDVGMVTRADVVAAESALAEARHALTELATQHAYVKLLIQKPWAPMYTTT